MTDTNRLKSAMALCGLTQEALADKISMTRQALSNKMNNKSLFNQLEIAAIAHTLNLNSEEINSIFFASYVGR